MVALAEMKMVAVRRVSKVAEAYAHVTADGTGHRDGHRYAEDGVYDSQRVEVAITKKEQAGDAAPDEGHDSKDGVREMR
jgi:hypothetical protein